MPNKGPLHTMKNVWLKLIAASIVTCMVITLHVTLQASGMYSGRQLRSVGRHHAHAHRLHANRNEANEKSKHHPHEHSTKAHASQQDGEIGKPAGGGITHVFMDYMFGAKQTPLNVGALEQVGHIPPYYTMIVTNTLKTFAALLVFGPPSMSAEEPPDGSLAVLWVSFKQLGKSFLSLAFIGSGIWCAWTDLMEIVRYASNASSFLSIPMAALIIVISSPNFCNAYTLMGVNRLYAWGYLWQKMRKDPTYELPQALIPRDMQKRNPLSAVDNLISALRVLWEGTYLTPQLLQVRGPVYIFYMLGMVSMYAAIPMVVVALILPTMVFLYPWVTLPVMLMGAPLYGCCGADLMLRLTGRKYTAPQSGEKLEEDQRGQHNLLETDEGASLTSDVPDQVLNDVPPAMAAYMHFQPNFFQGCERGDQFVRLTGCPQFAWQAYFQNAMLTPIMHSIVLNVAIRFALARGYWPAVRETFMERRLADYIHYVISSFRGHVMLTANLL